MFPVLKKSLATKPLSFHGMKTDLRLTAQRSHISCGAVSAGSVPLVLVEITVLELCFLMVVHFLLENSTIEVPVSHSGAKLQHSEITLFLAYVSSETGVCRFLCCGFSGSQAVSRMPCSLLSLRKEELSRELQVGVAV